MELSAPFTRALLAGFGNAYTDLLRLTTRSTGCREDARDLVHDTWVRLAEHEHNGTPAAEPIAAQGEAHTPRDVTAYLGTMAQNLALDHLRRNQRLAQHKREELQHTTWAPQHTPDVADAVMYRQAIAVLESTLAALPERTRNAFVAHRVHGEKQTAIAARMGVSLNTIERDLIQANACIEDALHRWRGTTAGATHSTRRRNLGALLSLAGVGLGGTLAWQQWQLHRDTHVQWQAALASPRGQVVRSTLPDGSTLQLDALGEAQVRYYATRRTVQLARGAAFFTVAHDAESPFTVQAQDVRVTVLGTRFGVELLDDGPRSSVLVQVESGHVRVEAPGRPTRDLRAGDGLRITPDGQAQPMAGPVAPWRNGELLFTNTTLGDALTRLSRYAPFDLRATPEAARLPVSGQVRIARARAWLDTLPHAMPVRMQPQADGGVLFVARAD